MSDVKGMLNRAQASNDPWAASQRKAAEQKQAAKKPSKKKKNKKGAKSVSWQPHSAWGCAWRSAVATLALFAFYFVFGLLFNQ